jgi:hypothetical protein
MTVAFVLCWTLACGLMASGCLVPALIVAGIGVLFGARWWLEHHLGSQGRSSHVHRVHHS